MEARAPGHAVKILEVNNVDLQGRRYNGYDLLADLEKRGIDAKQAVLSKLSGNPGVATVLQGATDRDFQKALSRVEDRNSMNNLLFPWGSVLQAMPEFADADVVHYHVIHNQVLSLFDLPRLFAAKPSVWTFHDPWPLTGHCVHPQQCPGWLSGCVPCPYLDRLFPMREDRAGAMWAIKQRVYAEFADRVDVVVASEFMQDMVRRSPLTSHFERVHLIPFGVDASLFLPDEERASSRRALGIPEDHFVLLLRASTWPVKGLSYIIEALASKAPERPTTLLTVDQKGLLAALSPAFNLVERGWVADEGLYPRLFSAADVLLMPSVAEAFGLMAVEAMAAGRPVVCFEGTALPSVTRAPECGIAVPMGDARALREAIDRLSADPAEAARRGALGREIAAERYDHERYVDALVALYREVS